jgi:hypothetical protein
MVDETHNDQEFIARMIEAAMAHNDLGDPCLLDAMRAPEDMADVREMTVLQAAVDLFDTISLLRKQQDSE